MIAHRRAEQVHAQRQGIPLARDPLIEDLMAVYKKHVEMRNRPSTRRINLDNLRRVMDYLRARLPRPRPLTVSDFHPELLEEYMRDRLRSGIKPATINRERCTWASFFARAARRGMIRMNPMKLIDPLPDVRRRLPVTLSAAQVGCLLRAASEPVACHGRGGKGAGNTRPRLTPLEDLITTALNTGARLGELVYLEWSDVDWEARRLRIVNKDAHLLKDREDRQVAINGTLMTLLRRRSQAASGSSWIFPSQTGGPLDRRNLLRELSGAAERAGIQELSWNILRHTALTQLARTGAPMMVLREVAGHASSRTTEKFYVGSVGGRDWPFPEIGQQATRTMVCDDQPPPEAS